MPRVRLTAPAQVDGALREPGYEFDLPEDMRGPHTTRRISHDTIAVSDDSNRILGKLEDVPLYEVVEPEASPSPDPAPASGEGEKTQES